MILTKRQRQIFDFIQTTISDQGYAPTLEEIGAEFGLRSMATVHKHVSNLESKGLITRKWNHSRAIELVEPERTVTAVEVPLLGAVAAGPLSEAIENSDRLEVPKSFVRHPDTYALTVKGQSMIDDGILEGDYLLIEQRPEPRNGDTVVASVDGEVTVKRFYRDPDGSIRLQPANPDYQPIIIQDGNLEIRGAVVAVLRRYH